MPIIYIMRHGAAADKNKPVFKEKDAERPLTKDGIKDVVKIARGLRKIAPDIGRIITSPLKRAMETATLVAYEYNIKPEAIEIMKELAPGGSVKKIAGSIQGFKDKAGILLIGHEPDLSVTAGYLLGVMNINLTFKKGAVMKLDIDGTPPESQAALVWLMQPKQLRAIRGK